MNWNVHILYVSLAKMRFLATNFSSLHVKLLPENYLDNYGSWSFQLPIKLFLLLFSLRPDL